MNFTQLKANLLSQIGRAPSDLCYELVTADINQNLRLLSMLKEVTLTDPYTLPDDFNEAQNVMVGDAVLNPATEVTIGRGVLTSENEFAVRNGALLLDKAGSDVTLRYYAKVDDLSITAENPILTNTPQIYVYGVLAHHAALIRDQPALASYMPAYERYMGNVQREDNAKRVSSAPINIKAPASA